MTVRRVEIGWMLNIEVMDDDVNAIEPYDCPICTHDSREQIEEDIAKGILTRRAVAAELEMPIDGVHLHMKEHFTTGGKSIVRKKNPDLVQAPDKLRELYKKRDVLFTLFVQIKDRLDVYINNDSYKATDTKQITQMVDSIRRLAMDLAKLEGEFKTERDITINMYNSLKMIVLSSLCPSCQHKVTKAMADSEREAMEVIDLTKTHFKD